LVVARDVSLGEEKPMDRRTFLISSGAASLGVLFAFPDSGHAAEQQSPETFSWNPDELQFTFSLPRDASGSTSSCRQVSRLPKIPRVGPV